MKQHIALVGFMASGKSTIGKRLARKLKCAFFDTDDIVVKQHGAISDIFYSEGEDAFRNYEHDAIASVVSEGEAGVLACGGGALSYEPSAKLLKKRAYRIFIKVTPEQVLERLRKSRTVRPLLGPTPSLARIKHLYTKRMPQYAHADCVIEADGMSSAQVVEAIVEWLHKKKIEI
ncbi:MAG TPA: shikimate kinase [Candidatus Baltobacteraceae bacterium]|nr:shikimate kinase [Candidatus Baltobacteraceae bacterium]